MTEFKTQNMNVVLVNVYYNKKYRLTLKQFLLFINTLLFVGSNSFYFAAPQFSSELSLMKSEISSYESIITTNII